MRAVNFSKGANFAFLALIAALIYAVSNGIRVNLGILLDPLSASSGVSYATLSLILATGQFAYGLSQPLFGLMALRRSYEEVLLTGCAMLALGLIGTAYSSSAFSMFIFLGIIFYAATGALCFGLVLSCMSTLFSARQAIIFSGILNAAAGVGSSFFSPTFVLLLEGFDISTTLLILSSPVLLMVPISIYIGRLNGALKKTAVKQSLPFKAVLRQAIGDRSYQIMLISFAICGFHMGIIFTHLYSEFIDMGLSSATATFAYTLFGLALALGAFLCGFACIKYKSANVLGFLYASRALIVLTYLFLLPKNEFSAILFACALGLTCDATVAPTSLIVNARFGAEKLAVLFGLVYISHQAGCFVSAALGGYFVNTFNSYALIWLVDISLCVLASLLCLSLTHKTHPKHLSYVQSVSA
jgi:MFS family permease